jgi:hypothetical protein
MTGENDIRRFIMTNYRWRAKITLDNNRTVQEVYVEAPAYDKAKAMILAIYTGCRITWGPVQA